VERSDKLAGARDQWNQHHTLPSPEEIGIPAIGAEH